jgi:hypothetical protein
MSLLESQFNLTDGSTAAQGHKMAEREFSWNSNTNPRENMCVVPKQKHFFQTKLCW